MNVRRIESAESELTEPDCPVESAALVYFDLETTGLHPERGAEITQVAILDDGGLRLHWERPDSEQPLGVILPKLLDHLGAGVVVGHNLVFDFGFVAYEAARRDARGPRVRFVDTLSVAKNVGVDAVSYELESLVDHYEIDSPGALHTATGDARATRKLFWRLVESDGLRTLGDLGMSQLDWSAV